MTTMTATGSYIFVRTNLQFRDGHFEQIMVPKESSDILIRWLKEQPGLKTEELLNAPELREKP